MTREADIERTVQAAVDRFGGLDIMVNNAGVYADHAYVCRLCMR